MKSLPVGDRGQRRGYEVVHVRFDALNAETDFLSRGRQAEQTGAFTTDVSHVTQFVYRQVGTVAAGDHRQRRGTAVGLIILRDPWPAAKPTGFRLLVGDIC